MIIADSCVWIDLLAGTKSWQAERLAELLEEGEGVALCDRVLQEVLQGIREDKHYREARDRFLRLPCFNLGGHRLAIRAASNYRLLRARGITPRSAVDVLIATFCADEGHHLLHHDRDFDEMAPHVRLLVSTRQ